MASFDVVPVRASIVGAGISASTPNIVSFYVRVTRGELSTFSFSVKQKSMGSGSGMVSFMLNGSKIYTGIITSIKVRPCFEDPSYVIIDGNGTDVRMMLQGKTFTRRSKQNTSSWGLITGVVRKGLKNSKLAYTPRSLLGSFIQSPDSLENGGVSNQTQSGGIKDQSISPNGSSRRESVVVYTAQSNGAGE